MQTETSSAWNPGIEPEIPEQYQHLETTYDPANVFSSYEQIQHLTNLTGLPPLRFIVFKPHRLALQEVIMRVTADILIREGDHEEDLGIRFREVSDTIMQDYVELAIPEIEYRYNELQQQVEATISKEIESRFFTIDHNDNAKPNGFWESLFTNKNKKGFSAVKTRETTQEREFRIASEFKELSANTKDETLKIIYLSLFRVLSSIVNKRGFLGQDREQLTSASSSYACNILGRLLVRDIVNLRFDTAIKENAYPLIPDADKPILISLKGASAAGKSSLRPMLQKMMHTIGIENFGYGIISPDIWRKSLLDYGSLGDAYKYAGRMTSLEVNVIDAQLDRYIREKSQSNNAIPHLLVDRFRFDSFASENISKVLHKTYASSIHTLYMFFVITPPEATVERGWLRGQQRGRYKCVEDFLGHCVEAYTGTPKLFFKWMNLSRPYFVFEFLDNSVEKGQYPSLIARGTQDEMDIHDPMGLINIERYKKINILAESPDEVYPSDQQMDIANNMSFLLQCISKLSVVTFVDSKSKKTYLQTLNGKLMILDEDIYKQKKQDNNYREIFTVLATN